MLPASHLISHGVPGHGPPDGKSTRVFSVTPCSSCNNNTKFHFPQVKIPPFQRSSRVNNNTISFICNANSSGGGQRRNPDFSRQNRQGYSRNNKSRNNEERDNIDGFEDSEVFSTKNGQSFLSNTTPKFQSAATPGPREREIVEIFKKVQSQLRERAAQKEEKKVEDSQGNNNKQNETVDSLLKLLRKHSVQHGKNVTNNRNNQNFVLDNQLEPESNNSFIENPTLKKVNNFETVQSVRPASNFQKRIPVTKYKYKPILSGEESFNPDPFGKRVETRPDPEPEVKMENRPDPEVENESFRGFDESSDDENSDIEDAADEIEDLKETNEVENIDLGNMKLVELREVAKSRGIKGYSRLKKLELLELLSS